MRSLREYGAGRAVLIDRKGRILAGHKTIEQAKRLNLRLHVVQTDGQHLVAVQRLDLDLANDARARALAIADNRVGELDLEWDVDMLKQAHAEGLDLSAFWTDAEFKEMFAETNTGLTDENTVLEPGPTDIVRGELFTLGRHRLLGIVKLTHDLRTAAQFVALAAALDRNPLGVGQTVFRQLDNALVRLC